MGEKREQYNDMVGKFHLAKEGVKEKLKDLKDGEGRATRANEFKEDVIRKINKGDEAYDHLYRYVFLFSPFSMMSFVILFMMGTVTIFVF